MKTRTVLLLIFFVVTGFLLSTCNSIYGPIQWLFDDGSNITTPALPTPTETKYGECLAHYVIINSYGKGLKNDHYEFLVIYNEECRLPDKSCTFVDTYYSGGPTCVPLD
jgi:hypothetical protein